MKIFISGASGLVGGNCMKHFKEKGTEVLGTHYSFPTEETVFYDTLNPDDERNPDVDRFAPDVIVHCGALTHVDYCEDHEEESYLKTVKSTENLLSLAERLKAKFVFISTDYVFDGKDGPYTEDAPTNPLSVYARHKLEGERLVNSSKLDSLILRVTNVFGNEIRSKNFVARILEQIKEGKELTLKVPVDQYATPINAYDIARAMYLLLSASKTGLYHLAASDFINRKELCEIILKHFPGHPYEMNPMLTKDLNQKALRPLKGGLLANKFLAEFPTFKFQTVNEFLMKFKAQST